MQIAIPKRRIYTDKDISALPDEGVYMCNNCGAFATNKDAIVHFISCKPGEAERWEKFYKESK
jgi:hypothetical protein